MGGGTLRFLAKGPAAALAHGPMGRPPASRTLGALAALLVWAVLRSSALLRRFHGGGGGGAAGPWDQQDAAAKAAVPLVFAPASSHSLSSVSPNATALAAADRRRSSEETVGNASHDPRRDGPRRAGASPGGGGGTEAAAAISSTLAALPGPSASCAPYNSLEWLRSERWGNAGEHFSDDDARRLLARVAPGDWNRRLLDGGAAADRRLPAPKHAWLRRRLSQSLCYEGSRFANLTSSFDSGEESARGGSARGGDGDAELVRTWTTRLIYLGVMHHQHRHAGPEAAARHKGGGEGEGESEGPAGEDCNSPARLQRQYGVGRWDYECKGAKFLVTSLANVGIGANVRGGIVEALVAGLVSDRVVLFVNSAPVKTRLLRAPWALASCPRGDYQCFFSPPTPCALALRDLEGARRLSKREGADLRSGVAPRHLDRHRVWRMRVSYTPLAQIPVEAARRLHGYAMQMLETLLLEEEAPPAAADGAARGRLRAVLAAAADGILQTNETRRPGYSYGAANLRVHHALALYATRPNPYWAKRLREVTEFGSAIVPEHTVGLPIRASDKCARESECLSFEEHLRAASALLLLDQEGDQPWRNQTGGDEEEGKAPSDRPATTLVFTSESRDMVRQFRQFRANDSAQSMLPFRFRFVANERDVTPDSGYAPSVFREGGSGGSPGASSSNSSFFTADEAMLSAVASIRHQLLARVTVGNCCSNFHVLLADLLQAGCGAAPRNTFHCLQEHPDPRYRVCCGWFRNCKEEKRKDIERMDEDSAAAAASSSGV